MLHANAHEKKRERGVFKTLPNIGPFRPIGGGRKRLSGSSSKQLCARYAWQTAFSLVGNRGCHHHRPQRDADSRGRLLACATPRKRRSKFDVVGRHYCCVPFYGERGASKVAQQAQQRSFLTYISFHRTHISGQSARCRGGRSTIYARGQDTDRRHLASVVTANTCTKHGGKPKHTHTPRAPLAMQKPRARVVARRESRTSSSQPTERQRSGQRSRRAVVGPVSPTPALTRRGNWEPSGPPLAPNFPRPQRPPPPTKASTFDPSRSPSPAPPPVTHARGGSCPRSSPRSPFPKNDLFRSPCQIGEREGG